MVRNTLSFEIGLLSDVVVVDQCQPPSDSSLADTSAHGLNMNGSVCLNGLCQYVLASFHHKPKVLIVSPDMLT